jgi:hypothetical protein
LDGFLHRVVEVVDLLPDDETNATNDRGAIAVIVTLHIKDLPPKAPVRLNAEEGLADGDKYGKVKDRIWGQLPELNPIEEKEGAKKLVSRKRKTTKQESLKHDGETLRGLWASNRTWETNVFLRCGDEAEGAKLVDITIGNGGGAPITANFDRLRGAATLLLAHGERSFC